MQQIIKNEQIGFQNTQLQRFELAWEQVRVNLTSKLIVSGLKYFNFLLYADESIGPVFTSGWIPK